MSGTAPALKDEEQAAKDRRASRKAAAACLARQRHKSFVHNLQDSVHGLRYRVDVYKARRGHLNAVCASEMLRRIESGLSDDKRKQLMGWLQDSSVATLAGAAPPVPAMPAALKAENAANAAAAAAAAAAAGGDGATSCDGAASSATAATTATAPPAAASASATPLSPARAEKVSSVATPTAAAKAISAGSTATTNDAEVSRQHFMDQLAASSQQMHQLRDPSGEPQGSQEEDFSHYDTPLGLTPAAIAPLPLGLQSSLQLSHKTNRKVRPPPRAPHQSLLPQIHQSHTHGRPPSPHAAPAHNRRNQQPGRLAIGQRPRHRPPRVPRHEYPRGRRGRRCGPRGRGG